SFASLALIAATRAAMSSPAAGAAGAGAAGAPAGTPRAAAAGAAPARALAARLFPPRGAPPRAPAPPGAALHGPTPPHGRAGPPGCSVTPSGAGGGALPVFLASAASTSRLSFARSPVQVSRSSIMCSLSPEAISYSDVMWMQSFGHGGMQNSQKMHFL